MTVPNWPMLNATAGGNLIMLLLFDIGRSA